jgi:SAM-dependent methyltransferase
MNEMKKSLTRRVKDSRFANRYFVGKGIDIGAGQDGLSKYLHLFPKVESCYDWDLKDGDAMNMEGVADNTYDFVTSSHCLEHLAGPWKALMNWVRITKPGGHLVILVPDEDLYEQGVWPSTFNDDHKHTFTISKEESWSPNSESLTFLLDDFTNIQILKLELLDETFNYDLPRQDQTLGASESAIEIILRKLTQEEIDRKGRLPKPQTFNYKTT